MAYQVAVASSDGTQIDGHFGSTEFFWILNIIEDGTYETIEKRTIVLPQKEEVSCNDSCNKDGCGSHREDTVEARFEAVCDCRCVLSARCGAFMERQLHKRGISSFAIMLPLEDALDKIIKYYKKIDKN